MEERIQYAHCISWGILSIGTCICLSMTFTFHWNHRTGIIRLGYTEKFLMHPTMDRRFITLMGWPESPLCMGFLRFTYWPSEWTGFSHHLPPNPTSPKPWCFCWGCNFLSQMMCQVHFNKLSKVPWRRSGKLWKSHWLVLGDLSW